MSWGGTGLPDLPQTLSSQVKRKQLLVDVATTEITLGESKYPLENIEYGVVVKLLYDGNEYIVLKPGVNHIGEWSVWYKSVDIKPPAYTPNLMEVGQADDISSKEAYDYIRAWVEDTIYHPLDMVKDVVALYTLYTWFHRFWPKKAFMTITGFFGTGKSAVGAILKAFGRFTIQTDPGMKTSEWEAALLQGVMLIDEAESLKRSHLAKLRKMHDEGFTVSKMMGAPGGWAVITLHLSVPVVLIGTHLPEDPALISRGLVIKMHYGTPKGKAPPSNSQLARMFRASMVKTVLREWADYTMKLDMAELQGQDLNMRERDVYTPLCALALHIGRDKLCETLKLMVKLSSYIAQTITPGRRLATMVAEWILANGERVGRFIRVPEDELYATINALVKRYQLDPREAKYVTQYFISASYARREGDSIMLYFLEDDVRVARGEDVDLLEVFKQYGFI